ncbi:MAG: N-acetylglucosamine-6-phosphate deacetylase [Bdellovibrionales bacterium]
MPNLTALCDAVIFTGDAFVEGHALVTGEGKIVDIVSRNRLPGGVKAVSCADKILVPGFIDAQVNGGGNVMFNNTPTAEACLAIARAHRRFGTTRLLPTCITDHADVTRRAFAAMRDARKKDKGILGIHVEGPHLSEARRGVHLASLIRPMQEDDIQLYRPEGDETVLVTVAPETVPPVQILRLRGQGAVVALGHTQAGAAETRAALQAGATGFTHLFNGMGGLSARGEGPADVALDDRDCWCSIIADGHHVSAEMIRLALRAKPGRIFLVSDAMPPSAADDPQPFDLYGETIRAENGRCVNGEGKLAGAVLTMAQAVHNCINKFGIDPREALCMATVYPAEFLGLRGMGKLLPGFAEDVVVMNAKFGVEKVMSG